MERLAYTRSEVAKLTGVCIETVKNWERRRLINSVRVGGRVLIPAKELEQLVGVRREVEGS